MAPTAPDSDAGPGSSYVGVPGIIIATTAMVILTCALLYFLITLWPASGNPNQPAPPESHHIFGLLINMSHDTATFVIVALAGSLGGVIHGLRSLYWYVGNRSLKRSWLVQYVCVPIVGASLGVVFYVVLRGGLFSSQASSSDLNPYGFAAISALVGLFSEEAAQKLKQIFTTILAPAEQGSDHVPPAGPNGDSG
jgi:hypothetical protein